MANLPGYSTWNNMTHDQRVAALNNAGISLSAWNNMSHDQRMSMLGGGSSSSSGGGSSSSSPLVRAISNRLASGDTIKNAWTTPSSSSGGGNATLEFYKPDSLPTPNPMPSITQATSATTAPVAAPPVQQPFPTYEPTFTPMPWLGPATPVGNVGGTNASVGNAVNTTASNTTSGSQQQQSTPPPASITSTPQLVNEVSPAPPPVPATVKENALSSNASGFQVPTTTPVGSLPSVDKLYDIYKKITGGQDNPQMQQYLASPEFQGILQSGQIPMWMSADPIWRAYFKQLGFGAPDVATARQRAIQKLLDSMNGTGTQTEVLR